ncbi:unnamed protein product [Acanthosepion pharaonis]|uniref:Uncharacterized protein n=1 Tax=Acanthosepion pharaonis TaxID=158019 RepID=A0A812EIS4_ACAPH|nr:unnamed protein product [Sepia pharaonis]
MTTTVFPLLTIPASPAPLPLCSTSFPCLRHPPSHSNHKRIPTLTANRRSLDIISIYNSPFRFVKEWRSSAETSSHLTRNGFLSPTYNPRPLPVFSLLPPLSLFLCLLLLLHNSLSLSLSFSLSISPFCNNNIKIKTLRIQSFLTRLSFLPLCLSFPLLYYIFTPHTHTFII